jgi:enoyl-CoA hydratase/carnithine racemase
VTQTLVLDRQQAGIVVLQLNRPKQLNAINEVMRDELTQTFATVGADTSANVVVLTGSGRGFCSGIDVRNFTAKPVEASDPAIDRLRFQEAMAALPQAIWDLPQPVIAAVNGPCVGAGFALCLASDIRICSTAATFGNGAILLGAGALDLAKADTEDIELITQTAFMLCTGDPSSLTGRIARTQASLRCGHHVRHRPAARSFVGRCHPAPQHFESRIA